MSSARIIVVLKAGQIERIYTNDPVQIFTLDQDDFVECFSERTEVHSENCRADHTPDQFAMFYALRDEIKETKIVYPD